MTRRSWFHTYLKSHEWKIIYAVVLLHGLVYLTQFIGLRPQYSLSALLIVMFFIPLAALWPFLKRLWDFSSPEVNGEGLVYEPNGTFTFEFFKTFPDSIVAGLFAWPTLQSLIKLVTSHPPIYVPIPALLYIFVYSYSIRLWVFYFMSRLVVTDKREA